MARSDASAGSRHVAVQIGEETGGLTAGQQGQDGEHGDDLDLKVTLSAFFRQGFPVNIFVPVCVIFASWSNHKGAGILSWSFSGVSVACLVASFLLHFFTCRWTREVSVRCTLAYLSVFLRIVAATFIQLPLDPAGRHLVVTLPLLLLALVLLFREMCFGHSVSKTRGKYWEEYSAQLKLRFDQSSEVVTFAFAGLLGGVLGYVKQGSSGQLLSGGRGYMAPDCFLSYSLVLGLLVQLLSTVPNHVRHMDTRRRMANVYLRMVAYASLMFLVLACVMAAADILREWVSIACFILVAIPVLFCWMENRRGYGPNWFTRVTQQDDDDNATSTVTQQDDDNASHQIILGFTASLLAALMASNSKYSTERGTAVSLSGWFKCSVFMELYGVLSYAFRMVLFSEMPEMRTMAFPKMVWSLSAFATIIVTIIVVALVRFLHPDELKNIF